MKKVFFDTNLWLRFFLKDNEKQYKIVKKILSLSEEGKFYSYTSSLVFLEINYVLKSFYKLSDYKILKYLTAIKKMRNITILEKTNLDKALIYFKKYKIKLSDCLLASQLKKEIVLLSFDKELTKIKEIVTKFPENFLKTISN